MLPWLVVSGAPDERNHPKMKFQKEKKKKKKNLQKNQERNAERPGPDPERSVPALPWAHALF